LLLATGAASLILIVVIVVSALAFAEVTVVAAGAMP
jgi:hypothetical protein